MNIFRNHLHVLKGKFVVEVKYFIERLIFGRKSSFAKIDIA
jgi:hypothetical protein